jgi:hypothetical protein
MNAEMRPQESSALDRMVNREEVLQICFWYQGEALGETYTSKLLGPFLNCPAAQIDTSLRELSESGDLEPVAPPDAGYRLTPSGRKKAGRLFAESFSDFQKQGHGECDAGCCDGDDHSQCGDECALH